MQTSRACVRQPSLHSKGKGGQQGEGGWGDVERWGGRANPGWRRSARMCRHDGDGVTPELAPLVDLINGLPDSREGACNVGLAAGKWPFLHHDIFRNDCDLACSAVYAKRALAAVMVLVLVLLEISNDCESPTI
jgi:hypothetical protein